jgi:hypothetical protein
MTQVTITNPLVIPTTRCKSADRYLTELFKKGELIGDYYLNAYGYTEPIKGIFEMKNDILHFDRGDLTNFTTESVIKLAIALGWKEEPMTQDESELNTLENESVER